ncbi:MAG TPA: hypothetical protein VFF69_03510 [Phycisphaerales bacterium]|nr:hypothetical protein [Phycisphaerales bacterium]
MHRRGHIALLAAVVAYPVQAQQRASRLVTVDLSGNADYATIQAAIDSANSAANATTILIDAGTYAEAVTLGSARDHVDLVGVDRDAVIIAPPADSDGVTIQGNGARVNTIRNLTIHTNDATAGEGRGIVIKDNGGSAPADIGIYDVTIRIDGANSDGVTIEDRAHRIDIGGVTIFGAAQSTIVGLRIAGGSATDPSTEISLSDVVMLLDGCTNRGVVASNEVEDMTIAGLVVRKPSFGSASVETNLVTNLTPVDCDILAHDGDGLALGPNTVVRDSSIIVRDSYGSDDGCGSSADDKPAVTIGDIDGVRIDNCYLEGRLAGIKAGSGAADVVITASDVRGGVNGVLISGASDVSLVNCRIGADSALGEDTGLPPDEHYGVHVLGTTSGIAVVSSEVSARSTTARDAIGVYVAAAPTDGPARVSDCTVTGQVTSAASGVARGAMSAAASGLALVGGSVEAADEDERQTDLYDLYSESTSQSRILASGTQFSRWNGAIGGAVGQEATVMRVVGLESAGAAAVLAATALQASEQEIDNPALFTQPDNYRVLSVTGNLSSVSGSVIIIGRDWGLRRIADSIILNGTSTVNGVKPFRQVDKVVLPPKAQNGETVSVGTTTLIGLHSPVSVSGDLLQIGRKTSAGTSYTIFGSIPSPNVDRGTVDISTLSPNNSDAFEFTYRASK